MKITYRLLLLISMVLIATSSLMASGQVGIYGIVSKVVFEPNDKTPERIQIWGAFTLVDGGTGSGGKTLTPQRGYLYFTLPAAGNSSQREAASKEWADFKAIAGTGQVVACRFGYIGAFSDELISRPSGMPPYVLMGGDPINFAMSHAENPIRGESVVPTSPDSYPLNMGLTKLSNTGNLAAVVKELQDALKR
jgi:hypothetical protein